MSRKDTLTPATVDGLKEGKLLDSLTPGLSIEIVRGIPVWRFQRRVTGTNVIFKRTLGSYFMSSIPDARAWASGLNKQVLAGLDPRAVEREETARNNLTVTFAHQKYMIAVREGRASRAKRINKPRTIAEKEEIFRRDIEPIIGSKLMFDVTEDDLTSIVMKTGKRAKILANRIAGELKVFFGWAASLRGKEISLPSNPAARLTDLRFPEKPRKRSLSLEEIALFLRALVPEPRLYQRAMLIWLLTAARLREVINARSDEFWDGVWTIPEDRTKNSRVHRIALGPWGQSLVSCNTEWLFQSEKVDGPRVSKGFYAAKKRIIAEMSRLAGRAIEVWTPHDLRRTARSNTKRLDVDFETAEAMLNHTKTGLERTYDGYALDDEKRDWFYRWEEEVARIAIEAGVAEALGVPQATPVANDQSMPRRWTRRHATRALSSRSSLARRRA